MFENELFYLITGVALGAPAGLSPGPMQALIISETLRHSTRKGVEAALAPLVTDAPIILLIVFAVSRLSNYDPVMGIISIAGAVFLVYLAYKNFQIKEIQPSPAEPSQSLKKGIIVNLLSPHPYLFWLLVGSPILLRAWKQGIVCPALFFVGFYTVLLGTFITIALCTGAFSSYVRGRAYRLTMRLLGVLLIVFAGLFCYKGFTLLGIL